MVAIQPAYGDARTRQHFADSLDHAISFSTGDRQRHLTSRQREELAALHPDGRAHFWGGTRSQATKIIHLRRGDLVLLTGQLHVRGVGGIGAVFDNEPFARTIWAPHPNRCSFEVVYSLVWFRRVEVPYQVLQNALGTSERDHFQALRLVRDEGRVAAVRSLLAEGVL
jgi:hypothetical protein